MATTPAPVTVLLPTHNHPRTLPYSIDSVLAQTFTDFRLIVICDGAAEETLDVVADAARSDPRVEVVTSTEVRTDRRRVSGRGPRGSRVERR